MADFPPPDDPTYRELYDLFGLTPLDEHLADIGQGHLRDFPRYCEDSVARRIGSTTWMMVAVVDFIRSKKGDYITVYMPHSNSKPTLMWISEYLLRIGIGVRHQSYHPISGYTAVLSNGCTVCITPTIQYQHHRGRDPKVFEDEEYARRATRRLYGPYTMIRYIQSVQDPVARSLRFFGMAEDEEVILEFTKEGAEDFLFQANGTSIHLRPSRSPHRPI